MGTTHVPAHLDRHWNSYTLIMAGIAVTRTHRVPVREQPMSSSAAGGRSTLRECSAGCGGETVRVTALRLIFGAERRSPGHAARSFSNC